jgi:uncharacterized membrane protein
MSEDERGVAERGEQRNVGGRIAEDLPTLTSIAGDYYRGEVDRAATWRGRLDQTTNWAVVVVAAILTWAFSGQGRPHYVVLIGILAVTGFLLMEANRYREYDVWRGRIRTMQSDLIAEAFDPEDAKNADWRTPIGDELRNPEFNISFRHALNHRLRRSYLPLLVILLVAWVARVTVYAPQEPWRQTASILVVPGELVGAVVAVCYVVLVVLTAWSARGSRIREFQE